MKWSNQRHGALCRAGRLILTVYPNPELRSSWEGEAHYDGTKIAWIFGLKTRTAAKSELTRTVRNMTCDLSAALGMNS